MALRLLRLRGALTPLSSLRRTISPAPVVSSPALLRTPIFTSAPATSQSLVTLLLQSRTFCSSSVSLEASDSPKSVQGETDPEDALFEGCDYKHWLFVIDFPRDPKPTPQEMVATYEEICAKGLNISIEEAKTKMYACSTTTYEGFQAVMSQEEAEKFHSIPGVVFVLPDSYLYPATKEYGGDKYINGEIIPRPPPYQSKKQPPRSHDRDGRHVQDRQRNSSYSDQGDGRNSPASRNYSPTGQVDRRGPMQNYGPPQDYSAHGDRRGPMQNYGPPQDYGASGDRRGPMQNNRPPQDYGASGDRRGPMQNNRPPQDYGTHGDRRGGPTPNYRPSQGYGLAGQGERVGPAPNHGAPQNYVKPGQGDGGDSWPNQRVSQNYGQPGQRGRDSVPLYEGPYNQNQPGNYPQEQVSYPQREQRGYSPTGQRDLSGNNRDYAPRQNGYNGRGPSAHSQETDGAQMYQEYEDGQTFSRAEQGDLQGEHRNSTAGGQSGTNQERY